MNAGMCECQIVECAQVKKYKQKNTTRVLHLHNVFTAYVPVCKCMHVCACMHVHVSGCGMCACARMCRWVCVCPCARVCIHVCLHVRYWCASRPKSRHVHTCAYVHVCGNVLKQTKCKHVDVCIHAQRHASALKCTKDAVGK